MSHNWKADGPYVRSSQGFLLAEFPSEELAHLAVQAVNDRDELHSLRAAVGGQTREIEKLNRFWREAEADKTRLVIALAELKNKDAS